MTLYLFSTHILLISNILWTTPTTHDFGEIEKGKPQSYTFMFKNTSDKVISIDNVRTECSCTASDWENEPIKPNETGKITVSYDSQKMGYFKKKIIVWFRKQKQAEKLYIEGEVVE